MKIIEVSADELCGPQDRGSYVLKGSLVVQDDASWRVLSIEVASGKLMIVFSEERPATTGRELAGPRVMKRIVAPKAKFKCVVEDGA